MLVLSSLHIYPIKATRGIDLTEAGVEPRGLAHDRRWMLVDDKGTFLSQREHARLALVRAHVEPGGLAVEAPAMPRLMVPVPEQGEPRLPVRIWKDDVFAALAEGAAHAWFSRYLGSPCRLVYMDEAGVRPLDPHYAPDGGMVSFADGYPLLLMAEASLADLNTRLDTPVPMTRFRPNVVVTGSEAYDEDQWRQVRIGGGAVSRCQAVCAVRRHHGRSADGGARQRAASHLEHLSALGWENLLWAEPDSCRARCDPRRRPPCGNRETVRERAERMKPPVSTRRFETTRV